jgi:hypothetical protein
MTEYPALKFKSAAHGDQEFHIRPNTGIVVAECKAQGKYSAMFVMEDEHGPITYLVMDDKMVLNLIRELTVLKETLRIKNGWYEKEIKDI